MLGPSDLDKVEPNIGKRGEIQSRAFLKLQIHSEITDEMIRYVADCIGGFTRVKTDRIATPV